MAKMVSDIEAEFGTLLVDKLGSRPFYALAMMIGGVLVIIFTTLSDLPILVQSILAIVGAAMIAVPLIAAARFLYSR